MLRPDVQVRGSLPGRQIGAVLCCKTTPVERTCWKRVGPPGGDTRPRKPRLTLAERRLMHGLAKAFLRVAEGRLAEEEYWRRYWVYYQRLMISWHRNLVAEEEAAAAFEQLLVDWNSEMSWPEHGVHLSVPQGFDVALQRGWISERYQSPFRVLLRPTDDASKPQRFVEVRDAVAETLESLSTSIEETE